MSKDRERFTIVSAPAENWFLAWCLKWFVILLVLVVLFKVALVVGAAFLISTVATAFGLFLLYGLWWLAWLAYITLIIRTQVTGTDPESTSATSKMKSDVGPPVLTDLAACIPKISIGNPTQDALGLFNIVQFICWPVLFLTVIGPAAFLDVLAVEKLKSPMESLEHDVRKRKICKIVVGIICALALLPTVMGTMYGSVLLWDKILPDLLPSKPRVDHNTSLQSEPSTKY